MEKVTDHTTLILCFLKVHLLDYNEDIGVLDKTVFMHPAGEIWWAVSRA